MAIFTDIIDERGYTYENQYVRVESVSIKNKAELTIEVGVYYGKENSQNGEFPHRTETFYGEYNLYDEKNSWEQSYDILKVRYPIHQDDL
jgi:hypothetical protein